MNANRTPLLPPALLVVLVLAGCVGGDEPALSQAPGGPDPSGSPTDPGQTPDVPATSEPQSQVKVDPNATFVGGAHKHDWWHGDSQVEIMNRNIPTGPGGVCAGYVLGNGCNQGTVAVRFQSDPNENIRPNIIFPGTGKMEVKVTVGQLLHPFALQLYYPVGSEYHTKTFVVNQASKTFTFEGITEEMTDPPHFRESHWSFYVQTTTANLPHPASLFVGPFHMTVTVFRDLSRELPVDPPHPDTWGGRTELTLLDAWRKTYNNRFDLIIASQVVSGPELPENKTVAMGTGKMVVTLSWQNSHPDLAKPGLEYCPANGNCGWNEGQDTRPSPTIDEATRRVFEFPVRPDHWDSPYDTKSRWSFTWFFDGQADEEYGIINGHLDWTIKILKSA